MTQELITRYQPGGDIYNSISVKYGPTTANAAAAAALSGDETAINQALTTSVYGAPLNESTASIFLTQIETDPLGAPLQYAENAARNTWLSVFKSPVFVLTAAGILFLALGGVEVIKAEIAKIGRK